MSVLLDSPPKRQKTTTQRIDVEARQRKLFRLHPLAWILLAGAIVRAGLWVAASNWSPIINDDARHYRQLATSLATTGRYADASGRLVSLRPPLYPAIVATVYLGFGIENDDAIRALQAVVGLCTTCLIYRLGVIAYSRRVGLVAAVLVCFYPSLLGYENFILSESFFTFFLTAVTWLCFEAMQTQRRALLLAAGIALALAALTRSIMLLFAPLVAVWIYFSWEGSWRRRLGAALIPVAGFALLTTPWAVRNTRIQKTLTIIDVMGGRNAMMGNYEHTPLERSWATISVVPEEQAWYRVLQRRYPSDAPRTQGQVDKLALRYALEYVWNHPWLTIKRDAIKFLNFWQLDRLLVAAAADGYFGDISLPLQLLLSMAVCGAYALILLACILGVCCWPPDARRYHWFLVISILFPCAIHTLIFAHSRYRLPILPLLAMYAAAAIVHRKELGAVCGTFGFRVAMVLSIIAVMGWVRELVFIDYQFVNALFG
jgi:4-amino-4-deoxy-L-arabinose transferase-like glycosyltransferase